MLLLPPRPVLPAVLATAALALAGCAAQPAEAGPDTLRVAASFYPVQFLAERIAGDTAHVTGLTPPGQEPHSLTLTGPDLAALRESGVVLYIGNGLQADVEKAVSVLPGDVRVAELLQTPGLDLLPADPETEEHHDAADAEPDAHDHGTVDPHFWLDPARYATAARAVADELTAADPENAAAYAANLQALTTDLEALDTELEDGLAHCAGDTLVVAHSAFGYFADRYGLNQVGIAGLSPDDEPDARTLADITETAQAAGVATVFFEEALPPKLAQGVAKAVGAEVAALETAEFIPADGDYLDLMRANGRSVQAGLDCK